MKKLILQGEAQTNSEWRMIDGAKGEAMHYLIENTGKLLAQLDFPKKSEYEDWYLNDCLTYWAFFDEKKSEIQRFTGKSDEAIIYTKYFWCTAFIKRFEKLHGSDAGLEQQRYEILEELETLPHNMVDWAVIESIDGKKTKSEFTEIFEKLSDDGKAACLIALCESIAPKLSDSDGAGFASEALEKCCQWLKSKNVEADYLYSLLDSEDGNCVFQFLNDEKDGEKENVWNCLSVALSYIIFLAYRFENQAYLPEPIECVDSDTIEYFFCQFQKICPNSDVLEKFLPSGEEK